jgi:hypothetical protein
MVRKQACFRYWRCISHISHCVCVCGIVGVSIACEPNTSIVASSHEDQVHDDAMRKILKVERQSQATSGRIACEIETRMHCIDECLLATGHSSDQLEPGPWTHFSDIISSTALCFLFRSWRVILSCQLHLRLECVLP